MTSSRSSLSGGLLEPVLVVELGHRIAAGVCGGLLAQLGAEVVLVEDPDVRNAHKWATRAEIAARKRSVVIDRAQPDDVAFLQQLLDTADVVLLSTDVSPADVAIGSDQRPIGQIVCDVTAFGRGGPLTGVAASEALVQAYGGSAHVTGHRSGPPAVTGAPLLEMEAAVYAASAVVAALRVRRLHGRGQRIDMAVYDVAVNALAAWLPLPLSGRPSIRNGNRHPTLSPWNSYQAADGWVMICAPTDDQWSRLCEAMAAPELAGDPRFATTTARMANADQIDAVVGRWTCGRTVAECLRELADRTLPSGPILAGEQLRDEPNLLHRGMLRHADDPVSARRILVTGCPVRSSSDPASERSPVIPVPGADRARVAALLRERGPMPTGEARDLSGIRPLDGVRIVEIGMNTVAPLAGRQLGALGADVIKIEPPRGDANRVNAPLRDDGQSYIFAISNTDKRGLVLDLGDDKDRRTLWRLLAGADVLIENLKPGSLDRLGVGADAVRREFPTLTYCSVNGFGHESAYPGRPALDTVVQAMSGVMGTTVVDGVPTKSGISIADQLGGQFGLLAVLAALEFRGRTGRGLTLDLAMQDAAAWSTHLLWNDRPKVPGTARIIEVADGYVALDGNPVAAERLLGLTRDDVVAEVEAAAPVLTLDDVIAHPQTAARGLLLDVPTADCDHWTVLGSPLRLLSTPARVSSAMPRLGVTDPALAEEIGLTAVAERGH